MDTAVHRRWTNSLTARETPTILLARRGEELPFDISGYRVVFYDDAIDGKAKVEDVLRMHLSDTG